MNLENLTAIYVAAFDSAMNGVDKNHADRLRLGALEAHAEATIALLTAAGVLPAPTN